MVRQWIVMAMINDWVNFSNDDEAGKGKDELQMIREYDRCESKTS